MAATVVSSRKNAKERLIDELVANLDEDDALIVARPSRLGGNTLEVRVHQAHQLQTRKSLAGQVALPILLLG